MFAHEHSDHVLPYGTSDKDILAVLSGIIFVSIMSGEVVYYTDVLWYSKLRDIIGILNVINTGSTPVFHSEDEAGPSGSGGSSSSASYSELSGAPPRDAGPTIQKKIQFNSETLVKKIPKEGKAACSDLYTRTNKKTRATFITRSHTYW
jgi:hypothetical protein